MKKCPKCRTENDPDRILCKKCEAPIINIQEPARPSVVQNTSMAAFRKAQASTKTSDRVWTYVTGQGYPGATDQEIQAALGIGPQSQTPARRKLTKNGILADSGRIRLTRSGRKAIVWINANLAD